MWIGTNDSNLLFETWIKWKIYHDIVICLSCVFVCLNKTMALPLPLHWRRSFVTKKLNKSVSVWSHARSYLTSTLLVSSLYSSFSRFITSSLIFSIISHWIEFSFSFSSLFSKIFRLSYEVAAWFLRICFKSMWVRVCQIYLDFTNSLLAISQSNQHVHLYHFFCVFARYLHSTSYRT